MQLATDKKMRKIRSLLACIAVLLVLIAIVVVYQEKEPAAVSLLNEESPGRFDHFQLSAAAAEDKQDENANERAFRKKMERRMKERRKSVRKACDNLGLSRKKSGKIELITAEKYKLVYCPVPKTGCSNLKRVMLSLNGYGTRTEDIFPMKVFGQTDLLHKEVNTKFMIQNAGIPLYMKKKNYTKFLVVRHPLERALSGYQNKLTKRGSDDAGPQFYKRSQQIRERFGRGSRRNATGEAPTFEEFVDYLYDANNTHLNGEDNHWNTVDVVCFPCQNDYDIIATMETIDEDLRYLTMVIGAPENLSMPNGYSENGKSNTNDSKLKEALQQLPRAKLAKFYSVYKSDFQMFGYKKP